MVMPSKLRTCLKEIVYQQSKRKSETKNCPLSTSPHKKSPQLLVLQAYEI
jgi:hypothetical protein